MDLDSYLGMDTPDEEEAGVEMDMSSMHHSGVGLAIAGGGSAFATPETYVQCSKYLNETLQMYNFPGPIVIEDPTVDDKVTITNALYALLMSHKKLLQERQDVGEGLHKLEDENRRLQDRITKLKEEVDQLDKEKWEVEMRRRQEESEAAEKVKKLSRVIAEEKKKFTQLANMDKQYKTEKRRMEKENANMQDKLSKLIRSKEKQSKPSMEYITVGGRGRAEKREDTNLEALHKDYLAAYDERLDKLMEENKALRESHVRLSQQLKQALVDSGVARLLQEAQDEDMVVVDEELQDALDEFAPAQFEMPFDLAGDKVEAYLNTNMTILREKAHDLLQGDDAERRTVPLRDLKKRLAEQKDLIREQDRLIRTYMYERGASGGGPHAPLDKRWSLAAEAELERELLRKSQRASVEKAREADRERALLEQERAELERERGAGAGGTPARARGGNSISNYTMQDPPTPAGVSLDTSFADE